jgi:succinyl-CoA synthetase alpha subunit
MAILFNSGTRAVLQGITGKVGSAFAARFLAGASPLVGGVTPGRGGQLVAGLPVFESCHEAVAALDANASFMTVPAPFALDAVYEAVDAGIKVITLYIENMPRLDAVRAVSYARARGVWLLGPNSAGCVSLGLANFSEMDERFLMPGGIGIVAKSGAMCAETAHYLAQAGYGASSIVSIGGDTVIGTSHGDILEMFEADPETKAVAMVGEIGGRSELEAAQVVARMSKPVVALVIGHHAPAGKQMGHAGAWIGDDVENAPAKTDALRAAGAWIAYDITDMGARMCEALGHV